MNTLVLIWEFRIYLAWIIHNHLNRERSGWLSLISDENQEIILD